jgi:hypothetical protein
MQKKATTKVMTLLPNLRVEVDKTMASTLGSMADLASTVTRSTGMETCPQKLQLMPRNTPNTPTDMNISTIDQSALFQQGSSWSL